MRGTLDEIQSMRTTIEDWQKNDYVHPLTCGNDSQNHQLLYPEVIEISGDIHEINLKCQNCDWEQDIPDFFTS